MEKSTEFHSLMYSPPESPKTGLHPKKVLLFVFWTARGIINWELLPQGESMNSEVYCAQLERMDPLLRHGPLKEKRVQKKTYRLLVDNVRLHISKVITAKLAQLDLERLPHPPYSPDLAPSDYYLFR